MSEPSAHPDDRGGGGGPGGGAEDAGAIERARSAATAVAARARDAGERHVSVAVPFRAFERNRTLAASVLAGGIAYRLFLWLLPFGLIVGGALGLMDADGSESAAAGGGLPAAIVNAIGDIARAADSNSWWLLLTGVPLLLWEGYTGARALQLIHSLIWQDTPPPIKPLTASLAFSGGMCVFLAAISLTWWYRDATTATQLVVFLAMIVPIAGLWLWVSLKLPHGEASWRALVPGALLVGTGFQITHGLVVYLLGPKLEKATSLYGGLGVASTVLFFMWVVGRIVVTAPILNSALDEELRGHGEQRTLAQGLRDRVRRRFRSPG
jgi:uncharacterized BrkB/YihY/UPF0761 family membrane protein